ncbi:MAG: BlaI/MecI/CopY family transcriptional regulator [Actinotalea sp.]|nr:BlaI/MecI/CopY family transcriptional regulator [Actinotalea sp.]
MPTTARSTGAPRQVPLAGTTTPRGEQPGARAAEAAVPVLGTLEQRVMDVLWDCPDQLCARRVLDRLVTTELAYTTVATVLTNLTRKGLAERVAGARRWNYRPALSREEYAAACAEQALDRAGDRVVALGLLAGRLSAADRAALRAALGGADVDGPAVQPRRDRQFPASSSTRTDGFGGT